jgi:hypothetical protein
VVCVGECLSMSGCRSFTKCMWYFSGKLTISCMCHQLRSSEKELRRIETERLYLSYSGGRLYPLNLGEETSRAYHDGGKVTNLGFGQITIVP